MCKGQQKRKLNSPSVSEFTKIYLWDIYYVTIFYLPVWQLEIVKYENSRLHWRWPAQTHLKLHLNWNIKFLLFSLEPLQYRFYSLHHCCSKMFVNRFLFWQRSTHFCAICVFNYINISIFNVVHDPFFILVFQLFLYLNLPAF